jgi:signal transduction histidine kinase
LAEVGKLGVIGMQERAQLVGGSLNIQSELGKGTVVVAEVPV